MNIAPPICAKLFVKLLFFIMNFDAVVDYMYMAPPYTADKLLNTLFVAFN